jgi:hypothetical protein
MVLHSFALTKRSKSTVQNECFFFVAKTCYHPVFFERVADGFILICFLRQSFECLYKVTIRFASLSKIVKNSYIASLKQFVIVVKLLLKALVIFSLEQPPGSLQIG